MVMFSCLGHNSRKRRTTVSDEAKKRIDELGQAICEKGASGAMEWFEAEMLKKIMEEPEAIKYMPFLSGRICEEAVRQGLEPCYIPTEYRDRNFWLAAVKKDARHFNLIIVAKNIAREAGKKFDLDPEICIEAVRGGVGLEYIPAEARDREVCMAAVSKDGSNLMRVPEGLRDREMCMAAVNNDGLAIQYVPEELKDREMCMAAVNENGFALRSVPKNMRNNEIYMAALSSNGNAIGYIPEEERTHEICLAVVKNNGYNLEDVPKEMRDREICLAAVKNYGPSLKKVPMKLRDVEMCAAAVKAMNEYAESLGVPYYSSLFPQKEYDATWESVPKKIKEQVQEFLRNAEAPDNAADEKEKPKPKSAMKM